MRIVENLPHLHNLGIQNPNRIYWQLNTPQLYEEIIRRHEGFMAHLGPLVVRTGNHTSRAHEDRFIVEEPPFQGDISWGEINRPISAERFDSIQRRMTAYFQGVDVFVQDVYARLDHQDRLPIRVVTETAWHSLFARNSYLYVPGEELDAFRPEYTIIHAPSFRARPRIDHTNSETFILINLAKRLILIGGTGYGGEIKKAIFSVINFILPKRDVLSMECAANMDKQGNVALLLGRDGTGKTVLSTDPDRILIGDSEHGWSQYGIFTIGRGCYPNVYGLTADDNRELYETTRRFGTILENVAIDVSNRHLDLEDMRFTDNTHACYPISHIASATRDGVAGHPKHIILLTMDAFGVLPPVSKLTRDQAHYHFLSGYTSELVSTYDDVLEPRATFSACYGAPFMPLHPGEYAHLFTEQIRAHGVNVWLVNTGWTGGSYNNGHRIPLSRTRAILRTIFNDELNTVETATETFFGLHIPVVCPGVETQMLNPRKSWANPDEYDNMARELVKDFDNNYAQYVDTIDPHSLASRAPRR